MLRAASSIIFILKCNRPVDINGILRLCSTPDLLQNGGQNFHTNEKFCVFSFIFLWHSQLSSYSYELGPKFFGSGSLLESAAILT